MSKPLSSFPSHTRNSAFPFGPSSGLLIKSLDGKALLNCISQHIVQHLAMDLRVTDHAIAARDILFAGFELRFDQGNNPNTLSPSPDGKRGWG